MQVGRRTVLAAAGAGLALAATRTARAAAGPRARFVISVVGPVDGFVAKSWAQLVAEFEKRGFPSTFVSVIDPLSSFTPNATRAQQIVTALKDVTEPVVVVGVSNEGGVLPLVAAARPVRRIVYINATIPTPGKAFIEVATTQPFAVPGSILDKMIQGSQSVTDEFLKLRADPHATPAQWQKLHDDIHASQWAKYMPNFYEICELKKLPKVDNVDISGAADDEVSPAWEQATARRALKIEPVIIAGAGHVSVIAAPYASQVADAAVRGL